MLKKILATALAVAVISPMSAIAGGHLDKITIIQPSYPSMIFWPSHISAQLGFYEDQGSLSEHQARAPRCRHLSRERQQKVWLLENRLKIGPK